MATITGTAGTSINATCTVSNDGQMIAEGESSATAQSIENDIATAAKRLALGYTTSVAGPWIVELAAGGQKSFFGLTTVEQDKSARHDLDLPHGAVLTQIKIYVAPATHANLPGTMPTFGLWSESINGTGSTNITTLTDSSGTVGAYNAIHELSGTLGPSVTVDRNAKVYYLVFTGESGTDKDDIDILPPRVTLSA